MASITGVYQIGWTLRGYVKRELKRFCTEMRYQLELQEDKYWFYSTLYVKIICPDEDYDHVTDMLIDFIDYYKEQKNAVHV